MHKKLCGIKFKEYTNLKGIREIHKHLPPPRTSAFYQFLQLLDIPLPDFKLAELGFREKSSILHMT